MITLYGVTEDGTSVPVQVTEDGRVVAQGMEGPPGADGQPGADSQVPGPPGPQGEYGPGDDVTFRDGSFTRKWAVGPLARPGSEPWTYAEAGQLAVNRPTAAGSLAETFSILREGVRTSWMEASGAFYAAMGNGGFNGSGELIFWSRGKRWRLTVSGNLCVPEEYPIEQELQEKLEAEDVDTPDIVITDT